MPSGHRRSRRTTQELPYFGAPCATAIDEQLSFCNIAPMLYKGERKAMQRLIFQVSVALLGALTSVGGNALASNYTATAKTKAFEAYCMPYNSNENFLLREIHPGIVQVRDNEKRECVLRKQNEADGIGFPVDSKMPCSLDLEKLTLLSTNLNQNKINAEIKSKSGRNYGALCTVIFRHGDVKCDVPFEVLPRLTKATSRIIKQLESVKLVNLDGESVQCSCRQSACTTKEKRPCSAHIYRCETGTTNGISVDFDHQLKFIGAKTWKP